MLAARFLPYRAVIIVIALGLIAFVAGAVPVRGAVTATRITSLNAGTGPAIQVQSVTPIGDVAYFQAVSLTSSELWRTDGTVAGTRKASFGLAVEPQPPFSVGGKLLMLGPDAPGQSTVSLYAASAEPGTATAIKTGMPDSTLALDVVGGALLFTVERQGGTDLWRSDGTVNGTTLVTGLGTSANRVVRAWQVIDGLLYFFSYGDMPPANYRLWVSDGTASGTRPVSDPLFQDEFGPAFQFVGMGGAVYFPVTLAGGGIELWRSDGTAAGTGVVVQVAPPPVANAVLVLAGGERTLFYRQHTTGRLWVSDGTALGTKELTTRSVNYTNISMAVVNNIAIFATTGNGSDGELWRSDGTVAGTYSLGQEMGPQNALWEPRAFGRVGNAVLFDAYPTNGSRSIWQTDGSGAGTLVAATFDPSPAPFRPEGYVVAGNAVLFINPAGINRTELWMLPAAPFFPQPTPTATSTATTTPTTLPTAVTVDPIQPRSFIPHAER